MRTATVLAAAAAAASSLVAIATLASHRVAIAARMSATVALEPMRRGFRLPASTGRTLIAVASGLAGFLFAGPVAALAGIAVAIGVPRAVQRRNQRREASQLDRQLGDGISTIAAGLRAGLSLSQSLRVAADESHPPLSESLRAVVEREAMGQPLARSLDSWAAEHDGPDVRLVATVFQMHRRSGGDLPTVLDGVAATLRERAAQAREAQSLTAQARLSGIVLGFLPVGFFCFLSIMSPEDMSAAYQTPAGITAITAGILLQVGAFFWIRHLLRAEA